MICERNGKGQIFNLAHAYSKGFGASSSGLAQSTYYTIVERIDLSSLVREHTKLNVVAADLGHRHKSDDFNSFLMHLFF
jgi:hypothetical protein